MSDENAQETEELSEQEQIEELIKPKRQKQRASIDHLKDAVNSRGEFLVKEGEKLIVELLTESGFWMYTTEFVVQFVRSNGDVGLYNVRECRQAAINYHHVGKTMRLKIPNQLR